MPVTYNGNSLIPAPFVDLTKTSVLGPDGRITSYDLTFNLNGTIVNVGTPLDSPGAQLHGSTDMADILSEQKRIREIFSVPSGYLLITPPNLGSGEQISAYCTLNSINFQPSTWTNRCDYSISLHSSKIEEELDNVSELVSYGERWNIAEEETGNHIITHELEAIGKLIYSASGENNPLLSAKNWCRDRLYSITTNGFLTNSNPDIQIDFSGILSSVNSSSGNFWNYSIQESMGSTDYSWRVTETFLHSSGNASDYRTLTLNFEQDNIKRCQVVINGTVFGYADRLQNLPLRNNRAKSYYYNTIEPSLYSMALNARPSGYSVSPTPNSKSITFNENNGTVNYTCVFIASSGFLVPNAINETIDVQDTGPVDIIAQIGIPGRANGLLVQNMRTITLPERLVNINIDFGPNYNINSVSSLRDLYYSKPNVDNILNALAPSSGYYYTKINGESYNPARGLYNRQISWIIVKEGMPVSGIPNNIHFTD